MKNEIIQTYIKLNSNSRSITRGKAIFKEDDVIMQSINYETDTALFYVKSQSSGSKYEVEITDFDDSEHISAECDCPVEDEVCKHCVASLLYLERDMAQNNMVASIEVNKNPAGYTKKAIVPDTRTKEEIAAELKKKLDAENERKKNAVYAFRMSNFSAWTIENTWSSKARSEGEMLLRLMGVTLTPNKDKSVNAIVKDPFTGQSIEYAVYIEKTGQGQYAGRCTCRALVKGSGCAHRAAVLLAIEKTYGQDGFELFRDFDLEKNSLLVPFGYTINDNLSGKFEFYFQHSKLNVRVLDSSIMSVDALVQTAAKAKPQVAPVDRILTLSVAKAASPVLSKKVETHERINAFLLKEDANSLEIALIKGKPTKERDDIASSIEVITQTGQSLSLKFLRVLADDDLAILQYISEISIDGIKELLNQPYLRIKNWQIENITVEQQMRVHILWSQQSAQLFDLLATKLVYRTQCNLSVISNRSLITPLPLETDFLLEIRFKTTQNNSVILLEGEAYHKKFVLKLDAVGVSYPIPYCLLYKGTLYRLKLAPEQFALFNSFAQRGKISVRTTLKEPFINNILKPMQRAFDLETDLELAGIETITPDAVRQLYLKEVPNIDALVFHPIMSYNDIQVELDDQPTHTYLGGGENVEIERDSATESDYRDFLRQQHPQFAEQDFFYEDGCYFWLPLDDVLNKAWFIDFFAKIREEGIEIFGFNELKKFKYNTNKAEIQMRTSSGIDWFDVQSDVSFGGVAVTLRDLQKAIFRKEKFVKLADGSLGLLPEEWLAKYGAVLRMGEVKGNNLKLSKMHFMLLEQFEQIDETAILEELAAKRAKLQQFKNIVATKTPEGITATLRPYQKEGLNWLNFLHEFSWGGILADDMGLGKTLQVITFAQHLKNIAKQKKKYVHKTHLVVAPSSLIYNWESEIEKFAPELSALVYHGAMRKETDIRVFSDYDFIITTYGTASNDIEKFQKFRFGYLILDESQAIKNATTQRYKAMRLLSGENRLCMSGTPVENNTFDLYAQFNFLNPGMLGSMEHFRDQYATPIDKNNDVEKSQELRRLTQPFMLRRTKELVAKDLPEKTEIVLYCEMGKAQRKIYDAYREDIRKKVLTAIETEGFNKAGMYILQGLLRLRQICDSPNLINDEELTGFEEDSIKLQELKEHITERTGNHKLLIFSQFKGMLSLIREMLERAEIPYLYLDGSTSPNDRRQSVKKFQNEEQYRVFLISLKAGGTGLNLTAADYVYLVDPWWNPAVEQQAIDRTHRIGQVNHVFAYKMICKDSIEEKIIQLQAKKKAIAADLVASEAGMMKSLTKDDVAFLFS